MSNEYDEQIQTILAEQQQALNDINKQFHQATFAERMKNLATGLTADKDTREYKLAKIEAQRLSAPALAIIIPCLFMGALAILATTQKDNPPEYTVEVMKEEETKPLEKPEPPKPLEEPLPETDIVIDIDMPVPVDQPILDTVTAQPQEFDSVLMVKSPMVMKSMFGVPRDAGSRGRLLGKYGGTRETEVTVLRALRWLKKNQNSDGSWPKTKPAMTGLALLCFLSHAEIPGESEEFGDTVQRAIQYLISSYNGRSFSGTDGNEYSYLIAVYALCEAYGMTQNPNIRTVAEAALKRVIDGQHPSGGWDYKMAQTDRDDTSYMGWAAQALKAAKMARMFSSDPEWSNKLEKACKLSNNGFLKNSRAGGGFGYTGPDNKGLTSVGVLCMQFHGMGNNERVKDSLKLMDAWTPGWFANEKEIKDAGLHRLGSCLQYYYYYATQAKFHDGGKRWDDWNKVMKTAYPKAQFVREKAIEDPKGVLQDIGWWANDDAHADGHVAKEAKIGNETIKITDPENSTLVMDTCLAALQLMVYYRYLPTSTTAAVTIDDEIKETIATESSDVAVDIGNL